MIQHSIACVDFGLRSSLGAGGSLKELRTKNKEQFVNTRFTAAFIVLTSLLAFQETTAFSKERVQAASASYHQIMTTSVGRAALYFEEIRYVDPVSYQMIARLLVRHHLRLTANAFSKKLKMRTNPSHYSKDEIVAVSSGAGTALGTGALIYLVDATVASAWTLGTVSPIFSPIISRYCCWRHDLCSFGTERH
jgi:uncharacterized membrane protein